jgi:hypothetical protein
MLIKPVITTTSRCRIYPMAENNPGRYRGYIKSESVEFVAKATSLR